MNSTVIVQSNFKNYTPEQLEELAKKHNERFLEWANYYYQTDLNFYVGSLEPLVDKYKFKNLPHIICPFCKQTVVPKSISKISTGGIILIVVGLVLIPILVGILLIIFGLNTKDYYKICPYCKIRL